MLGLLQGASEFLPISSSGHLVVFPWLFGWPTPSLLFDAVVHLGTLLSILVFFGRDFLAIGLAVLRSVQVRALSDLNARLGWYVLLGSVPAAAAGLLLKDPLERLYHTPQAAAAFLAVTALLLAGSEWLTRNATARAPLSSLTLRSSFLIGAAQAAALAPGVSRSGATVAAALLLGLQREAAARYSFLLGAPVFLGAGILQGAEMLATDPATVQAELPALLVGFATSAVIGYAAIRFLLAFLRRNSLYPFAVYCLTVSVAVMALFLLRLP